MKYVPLTEIVDSLETGARPKGGVNGYDSGIPSLGGEHLDTRGGFRLDDVKRVPVEFFESMSKGRIRFGDILIVKDGATTGKTSLVRADFPFIEASINEHLFLVRINSRLADPSFVFHYLFSPSGQREILKDFRGATVGGIGRTFADRVFIPYPTLTEQKHIAAILDEADAIRRKRSQAIELITAIPQSMFDHRFARYLRTAKDWHPLSQVAEIVSGVAKGRKLDESLAIDVPYLRVANVQAGYLNLAEVKSIKAIPAEVDELRLRHGDVVLTEGGDYDKLGRGAMWEHDIPNCIHQNHVFRVRLDQNKMLPRVLVEFLQTPIARAYFLRCAKKTTNLASINMTQLRALPIPSIPIQEQIEFMDAITRVNSLTSKMRGMAKDYQSLFDSLVQRAFSGGL